MAEGVVVEDTEGCLIFTNPAAAKLLGYGHEELVGQHWTLIVPPDQRPLVHAANTRRERDQTDRYQLDLLHRNGTRVPVVVSSNPRFESDTGRFSGSVVVFTDIRDQVHAQRELHRRTDLLTTLYEASQIFLGQFDSETILESTCRLAVDRFGLEMAWVGMLTKDSFEVLPATAYGDHDGYLQSVKITWDDSPTGRGPTGTAIRTGRPVVTRQIDSDPNFEPWREVAQRRGYFSSAALPLLAGDRVLGTLNVYSTQADYFTDDQVQVLQSLANQAAVALENARLYEETQFHNRELLLLNRVIAASVDASRDVSSFLNNICRELAEAFGVPQSVALLLEDGRVSTKVRGEYNLEARQPTPRRTLDVTGSPALELLLREQAPVHLCATEADQYPERIQKWMSQRAIGALLLLPLFVEGQMIGSLGLVSSRPRSCSSEEVDLGRRVAEQVSGVLARARLAEAQQELSTAIEQAAESIVITDSAGNIHYANPAFERISGYRRAEAAGLNLLSLGSDGQEGSAAQPHGQILAAGQVWQGQFAGKRKDGSPFTEETTITPVRDPSGEIVRYIATMRDVTREIQLEEQFHRAQKMEAIGRLAGGIAHDFNNLLTVIHLSTRLLERGMRPEEQLWEHVRRIRESSDRATKLVKQLLTFSRKEVIQSQELDLNQVIADLSSMLHRIIGEDIKLQIEPADELWTASADPSRIEQVIMNLVVNARDAMPRGGSLIIETANTVLDAAYVALHVDVQAGDYVMLTVSDTGIGMDHEVKSHLFEPFFTTKAPGKGTGLGLANVFGIIKQSGGHIQVYSEVGYGTTFRIYLPRAGNPMPNQEARAPEHRSSGDRNGTQDASVRDFALIQEQGHDPTTATARGQETILVVEDEHAVRELAVQILESQGYRILPAKDGEEALATSAKYDKPIHLLLTDVIMPKLSGRELAETLQQQRPDMRVLYTSGYTHDSIVSHGDLGKDAAFLCKPLTVAGLIDAVRTALQGSA